jgi:hypothetical protein
MLSSFSVTTAADWVSAGGGVITRIPTINPTAKMVTATKNRLNHRLTTGEFADIIYLLHR